MAGRYAGRMFKKRDKFVVTEGSCTKLKKADIQK